MSRPIAAILFAIALGLASGAVVIGAARPSDVTPAFAPSSQKASRTPEQKKIDSRLLLEIDRRRGAETPANLPPDETGVKIDQKARALVDVRASVTPGLDKKLRAMAGTIVSTSVEFHSTIAWLPLLKLEQLAQDSAVVAIVPAAEAMTNR